MDGRPSLLEISPAKCELGLSSSGIFRSRMGKNNGERGEEDVFCFLSKKKKNATVSSIDLRRWGGYVFQLSLLTTFVRDIVASCCFRAYVLQFNSVVPWQ